VPPIGARLRAERRRRGVSVRGLAREIGVSASLISQIETEKSSPSVSTLYAITTALGISIEDLFGPGVVADDAAGTPPGNGNDGHDGGPDGRSHRPAAIGALPGGSSAGDGPPGPAGVIAAALGAATLAGPGATTLVGSAATALTDSGAVTPVGSGAGERLGPVVTPDEREVLTLDSGVTWQLLGRIPHKHVDFLLITYQPGGTSSSSGLLMRHSGTEFGFVISGELTLTLGFETHRLAAGDSVSFDSSTPHAYRNETSEPAVGVWFVVERSA
jgi:quercetin dioxygenase-like cupin family protein/DNA-binding XRE family transcriptional regulator